MINLPVQSMWAKAVTRVVREMNIHRLEHTTFAWTPQGHTWDSGAPKRGLNLIKVCSVIPTQKGVWRGLEGIVKDPIPFRSSLGTKEFSPIHMYCEGFREIFFPFSSPIHMIIYSSKQTSILFNSNQTCPYTDIQCLKHRFHIKSHHFPGFNCLNSASEPDHGNNTHSFGELW